MTRLLLRSGKDPFAGVCAESTLQQNLLQSNVGNQLFQQAVQRHLSVPGAEVVSNGALSEARRATPADVARVDEEFDAFVVPLANAFRPDFAHRLEALTALVEGLTIPTVVVGVGVQTDVHGDLDALAALAGPVRAFVAAVLERSATIGVRGEVTADYLAGLGFPSDAVEVIGCPSLYWHGPGFRLSEPAPWPGDDARIALNLTPGVPGLGDLCRDWTARHPRLEFVGQDNMDLALMLWGEERRERLDAGLPTYLDHPLHREGRAVFPLDLRTWVAYLAAADAAVGTRFHGNVTALLADTPSVLLAHDSRTRELAELHRLPHRLAHEVPPGTTVEELYAGCSVTAFNAEYPAGFDRYVAFLERNGLEHVFAEGRSPAAFDERLAAADLPPLVRPLPADLDPRVRERLAWLAQAVFFDSGRHPAAYQHPFPHPPPRDRGTTARSEQRETRRRLERHARRIEELERRLEALDRDPDGDPDGVQPPSGLRARLRRS
jgi:hypothetical protein